MVYCYRTLAPDLLYSLQSHPSLPFRLLHYLHVGCREDSIVEALTTSLPYCSDLRTFCYGCDLYSNVSESAEKEMWEAAVRSCRNLEVVRLSQVISDASCEILFRVLRRLSEREGIQPRKLRKIASAYWDGGDEKEHYQYTQDFKHLLPALQQ